MGASSAMYLMRRALSSVDSAMDISLAQSAASDTAAERAFIANLVFAESKSVRTSTIILASFNILAALATAVSILYDCYCESKRSGPKAKASRFWISWIHPAETFPLILSIGIVIQGIIFAVVQGQGLKSLFQPGCGVLGQFTWIALFIVPYIQLVFGLETTIRSFRKTPFQARGKYDVTICLVTIVVMVIGTWVPTFIRQERDVCFASLMWFVGDFGEIGFILLSTVAGLLFIGAIIIFARLSKANTVEQSQRIAASRMVYYMVVGFVSLAFVIPFFVSKTISDGNLKTSMMGTVVLNLSGLMNGLLQLFLRSNTATTSFGPKGGPWPSNKHEVKMWAPNELEFSGHIMDPVEGPISPRTVLSSRAGSERNLLPETENVQVIELRSTSPRSPLRPNPLRSNAVNPQKSPTTEISPTSHARKPSYSLFPTPESPNAIPPMPTYRPNFESVYDISDCSDLEPPQMPFGRRGHRRDSSVSSSATVQIGLRLSHAPGPMIETVAPHSATKYHSSVVPLPQQIPTQPPAFQAPALPSAAYSAPTSKFNINQLRERIPIPLAPLQTSFPKQVPLPPRSPYRPSPLANITTQQPQGSQKNVDDTVPSQELPIVLKSAAIERLEQSDDSIIQLSPSVYTPPANSLRRKSSTRTVDTIESLSPSVYTPPLSKSNSLRKGSTAAGTPLRKNQWI